MENPTVPRAEAAAGSSGNVTVEWYRQLDRAQRDQVAALVLGRLGTLPEPAPPSEKAAELEGVEGVAERARAIDDAMTHPANTTHLHRALHDLDLSQPQTTRQAANRTDADAHEAPERAHDPARQAPAGHRVDLPPRPARKPRPAPTTQPAQRPASQPTPQPQRPDQAPSQRPDGTPQPGREWTDPYTDRQPRLRW